MPDPISAPLIQGPINPNWPNRLVDEIGGQMTDVADRRRRAEAIADVLTRDASQRASQQSVQGSLPVYAPVMQGTPFPVPIRFDRPLDTVAPDGTGGGSIQFPFQIQDVSAGGTAKVNVRYGTCQDIEPTNTATDISITDSSTNYVYLHVTIDGPGAVTAVELLVNTTGLPANGNYDGYILLGNAVTGVGVITTLNQAATHSLRTAMCGRVWDPTGGGSLTTAGTWEFWGF